MFNSKSDFTTCIAAGGNIMKTHPPGWKTQCYRRNPSALSLTTKFLMRKYVLRDRCRNLRDGFRPPKGLTVDMMHICTWFSRPDSKRHSNQWWSSVKSAAETKRNGWGVSTHSIREHGSGTAV